jgi:predicted Zn-dependent protease
MTTSRLDTFRAMVARSPGNALARFGLATEALKEGLFAEAEEHLTAYLAAYEDEGRGFAHLAEARLALGRRPEARDALRRGVEAAQRAGHPGLAAELTQRLDDLEDSA